MSRTRSRTSYVPSESLWVREQITTYNSNPGNPVSSNSYYDSGFKSTIEQTGTITDVVSPRPPLGRAARKALRGDPSLFKGLSKKTYDPNSNLGTRSLHPCSHTKTSYTTVEPVDVQTSQTFSYYKYETRSAYRSVRNLLNYEGSPSTLEAALNQTPINTVGAFVEPDIFDLVEDFRERCDQYLPSNQMLGEPIVECEIFKSAFKAVLNPTRALRSLLEIGSLLGKKYRKSSLKTIDGIVRSDTELTKMFYAGAGLRQGLKHASNGLLTYSFGIRPAVTDLIDLLDTHNKVQKRLQVLRSNGGSFIPINVQQKNPSAVSAPIFPSIGTWPSFSSYSLFKTAYEFRGLTARIGGWGRVREDLNWSTTWEAYWQAFGLNKAIGLLWELIPYSFVVDWITNAQEHVNKFTRPTGHGPFTEIRGVTSSIKRETVKSLWMIPGISRSTGYPIINPSGPRLLGYQTTSEFSRICSLPKHQGFEVDLSSLGSFQYLHGAALLVQRWLK